MKNKLLILITLLLAAVLCFAACSNKNEETPDGTVVSGVKSIEIVEGTIPTQVNMGDTPDFSGIKVKVTFEDGTTKEIGFADVKISEIDTMTAGEKYITVTYGSASIKAAVMVVDPNAIAYVTNIKIIPGTVDAKYYLGQVVDMSDFQVEATYSTGKVDALTSDEFTFTPVDTASAGKKTFTVTYTANPEITATAEYEVIGVKDMKVITESFNVKKVYVGETVDTSNLELSVEFEDGVFMSIPAANLTIGTVDTATYGMKTLSITYCGVTIEYAIEVVGVVSIKVNPGSFTDKVYVNGTYSAPAISALAEFSDETSKALTAADLAIGALDTSSVGKKSLKVSYAGVEDTIEIEVVGVAELTIVENTVAKEILKGQTLDTSGIQAFVKYTDGTEGSLTAADLKLGSVDSSVGGDKKLSVTYLDKTVEFAVKVCTITALRVEGVDKVIPAGQPVDLTNMKVYGVYNDAEETEVLLTEGVTDNRDSLDINSEEKTLVVSYNGITASVIISSVAPELVSIEIRGWDKYVKINDTYNKNTVNVYATYNNGSVEKVSGFTVADIATNVAGTVKLTATYTEGGITKTAEVNVEVLPIKRIQVLAGTVPSYVYRGETLVTSNIKVKVIYEGNGYYTETFVSANALTLSAIDTSVGGTGYKFTVTYMGVTTEVSYDVIAESSISILKGSVNDFIRVGYGVDYSGLVLNITYSNGHVKQVKASELGSLVKYTGTEPNSKKFTVEYLGSMTDELELTLNKVVLISALNYSMPRVINKGQPLDYGTFKLTLIYENGDVYYVDIKDNPNTNIKITYTTIDVNTAKEQGISITYWDGVSNFLPVGAKDKPENRKYTFETSANIIVRGVKSVEIVKDTVFNKAYVGMKVDTSRISVKITYSDDTYIYVKRGDPGLTVDPVDTSVVGPTKLVVDYYGDKGYMEIKVEAAPTSDGLIFGALKPDELVARESYMGNFKPDDGINYNPYYVGDDNPYYFYLNVIKLDDSDNVININGKTVPTAAKIYMDGSDKALEGDELAKYVDFNPYTNAYDFTEDAITHTFRLVIRPLDKGSYIDEASVTKEHTVVVVDGYNIYHAWELNVMTNVSRDITQECMGAANAIDQFTVVKEFLKTKGITNYEQITDSLKSIVLHGNIDVQPSDIPPEYVYKDANGVAQGIYDQLGIFHRNLDMDHKSFKIYGNYYSVYSYNIPCVTPKNVANNPDEYSSSDLFKIRLNDSADDDIQTLALNGTVKPFEQFQVDIMDIATRDNDPNSNDQTASERHMRGLSSYKIGEAVVNMTSVNIDAFMTSIIVEEVNSTLNLNNCKLYNAWQGHLFLWNENEHQDDRGGKDQDTWSYIENLKVDITNSLLGKCGGPVILVQAPHYDEEYNKTCGAEVNADSTSEIYTHVTGQEAWFVAVGQTQLAAQIRAMSGLIQKNAPAGLTTINGFTSTDKIPGVETVTMLMVAMAGEGMSLNGDMCNASFTIDKTPVMKTHSPINVVDLGDDTVTTLGTFANPVLDGYASSGAPIFQAVVTGYHPQLKVPLFSTAYTDGATGCYTDKEGTKPGPEFYTGDHITLYYGGAAIVLDYVHK